jgi:hypothetical protein
LAYFLHPSALICRAAPEEWRRSNPTRGKL